VINFRFSRVLPVPSAESMESSESWWCPCKGHGGDSEGQTSQKEDLTSHSDLPLPHEHGLDSHGPDCHNKPIVQDQSISGSCVESIDNCFVADRSVVLHTSALRCGAWTVQSGGIVRCSRCRSELGRVFNPGKEFFGIFIFDNISK